MSKKSGFTLIELIITGAILSIVASFVIGIILLIVITFTAVDVVDRVIPEKAPVVEPVVPVEAYPTVGK